MLEEKKGEEFKVIKPHCYFTQHGTMVLSMEAITEYMIRRPRYWTRIVTVLRVTITGEDTPGLIIQVNVPTILISMYKVLQKFTCNFVYIISVCIHEMDMSVGCVFS